MDRSISEPTQFKKGNKAAVGASHELSNILRGKKLREMCMDFLTNPANGVESGTQAGAFAILKTIANGYKGARPPDRLKAIELMLRICGLLTEKVEVENVNPFQSLDNVTLIAAAERLVIAMKSNGVVTPILEEKGVGNGETGRTAGGN